ncbi:FkbM family methyltransferase [Paracoccaceae bacterium Fryx2]|nr:FkbM family methyltransferase [Paracoccaceae bacterium Fryx2]
MADYTINGVDLRIPDALMTGQLDAAMAGGKYEHTEADALLRHLRRGDRFLDLGAGAGYLASLAAGRTGAAVAGVEAGPDMAPVAQANLARNGAAGEIVWGAVVADDFGAGTVTFTVRRSFWASSLVPPPDARHTREVEVPALRIADLLARFAPTVLSVDVEGGELALFDNGLPPAVRLVMMELHPSVYGAAGVKRIFDALSATGLTYCPTGSRGATVVLERAH